MNDNLIAPELLAKVMAIKGGIDAAECQNLYAEARKVRDGCIVEVGSFQGRSTAVLALGTRSTFNVPVYAIDPQESFIGIYGGPAHPFGAHDRVAFFRNMLDLGIADSVRLVNLSSEYITGAWMMPVGLLFIDGDHRYRGVRRDAVCWLPHLRPDATVVFDDANDPQIGPYHVVEELVRGGQWTRGALVGKTATLHRVPSGILDPLSE